jgi:hypothetical protein
MTEYPARRDPKRPPMHPGALLREDVLPALGRDNKTDGDRQALGHHPPDSALHFDGEAAGDDCDGAAAGQALRQRSRAVA